jgi:kojibiose phosphorylase
VIEGDPDSQRAVRYNLFQTLIAAPRCDDRVSIPAKTLSGLGYRGHIFWDTEIFTLPFLTYTQAATARRLLSYRHHTLPGARRKAAANGFEGAMFAWESAATGDEVTPKFVPDPLGEELVRIWTGEKELHISADVAYAAWQYWRATGDDDWMRHHGAPLILETAVFWGDRVEYDAQSERYGLTDVIGPDEYHEHVDNNAFTNRMVQWHLETAFKVLAWLHGRDPQRAKELEEALDLTTERLELWSDIVDRMHVRVDPETGLIEQFEGFFELEDVDLTDYEPRSRPMQAILGIEGANRAQVLKQADVLMLLYLLRGAYDRATLRANWEYYAPRTDHTYGSSLDPVVRSIVACELGEGDEAFDAFRKAAMVDLENLRGNTPDGIHAASAGALWQAVVFGFGGVRFTRRGPLASPRLPEGWTRLKFRIRSLGRRYTFDLRPQSVDQEPQGTVDISGVIFDLDGVITDTSELHYRAWKRLADEEGISFDRHANERLRGVSRRESLMRLLGDRRATESQIQEMMARKNGYYQALIEDVTAENLLPGARELLHDLKTAGVGVAVASASKNARTIIERWGIGDLLDAVSDGYSVYRQKPEPDLFLHAAGQLGVPPERCVVVEDASSGVTAGLAAGMWTVGLGPHDRVGEADVVLPGLDQCNWLSMLGELHLGQGR